MPVKYQASEESILKRKAIVKACQDGPKTFKQISKISGYTVSAIRYAMESLITSKHMKQNENVIEAGREVFLYSITHLAYMPDKVTKRPIVSKDPVHKLTKKPHVTIVTANDYHHTRPTPKRRNAWIGSSSNILNAS
jgi:predicted transcriptional regulator